jgi:hypothetical protein
MIGADQYDLVKHIANVGVVDILVIVGWAFIKGEGSRLGLFPLNLLWRQFSIFKDIEKFRSRLKFVQLLINLSINLPHIMKWNDDNDG